MLTPGRSAIHTRGMTTLRRTVRIVAWTGALLLVLTGLAAAGHGALAGPRLVHPSSWPGWAAARPADEVVMAALRLLAIALAGYLLAVTVLGVALRLVRAGRLVRIADVVTVPGVRTLLQAGVGAGMTGVLIVANLPGATAAGASPAPRPAPVLVAAVDASAPPVMQKLDDVLPPPPAPSASAAAAAAAAAGRSWTVAPGEHLWSISGQVLALAWNRAPTESEVGRYWSQVLEANRSVLADPDNPDLIFPGQELTVPPPPPAP